MEELGSCAKFLDDSMVNNSVYDMNFKTLYWNFRSFQARELELESIVLEYHIVFGEETWQEPEKIPLSRA